MPFYPNYEKNPPRNRWIFISKKVRLIWSPREGNSMPCTKLEKSAPFYISAIEWSVDKKAMSFTASIYEHIGIFKCLRHLRLLAIAFGQSDNEIKQVNDTFYLVFIFSAKQRLRDRSGKQVLFKPVVFLVVCIRR